MPPTRIQLNNPIIVEGFTPPRYLHVVQIDPASDRPISVDYRPLLHIKHIDANALSDMCDLFRAEVFQAAEKDDPHPPQEERE